MDLLGGVDTGGSAGLIPPAEGPQQSFYLASQQMFTKHYLASH